MMTIGISLFALKVSGLVFDGGYTLGERLAERGKPQMTITTADSVPEHPRIVFADGTSDAQGGADDGRLSWAEQMFNYGNANPDITGSVPEPQDNGPKLKVSKKPPAPTKLEASGRPRHDRSEPHRARPASRPFSSACSSAVSNSTPAAATSICAKACSRPRKSGSKPG